MSAQKIVLSATLLFAASLTNNAKAATITLNFVGPGVGGTVQLTYGPTTDTKTPQGYEVTGISGTFTDTNNGLNLVGIPIGMLVPVTHDTPEPGNDLAPHDFSRFAVASGLGAQNNGFLTYDNLFYPGGSPQTASGYTPHGGALDIYGLMFNIGNGRVVNVWSNGTDSGSGQGPIYGIAVATHDTALDYVGGVSATPEPGTLALLGGGLLAIAAAKRRLRT